MTTETRPDAGPDSESPAGGEHRSSPVRSAIEWIVVFVGAILVAILIKTYVVQAFFIPSASMNPTLLEGDRVLVNKLSYHLHDVNRSDIIVFEKPPDAVGDDVTKDLIKRVIGLPGDNLYFEGGKVYVNGKQLEEPYLSPGVATTQGTIACTQEKPCKVPANYVWVMGDNRGNSKDSRYIGPIPEDHIVGRAFVRVWPLNRFGGL